MGPYSNASLLISAQVELGSLESHSRSEGRDPVRVSPQGFGWSLAIQLQSPYPVAVSLRSSSCRVVWLQTEEWEGQGSSWCLAALTSSCRMV